jgi:hypothetical protein
MPIPLMPVATVLAREVAYHGGRLATYNLGAVFGTANAWAMEVAALAPL